mmetsp:Transcript_58846/g.182807  ORF Transcript_58846/g.182807 Transcript_58846/m.182807 type:complete len:210 (-) Transcript_58846:116-745(-)
MLVLVRVDPDADLAVGALDRAHVLAIPLGLEVENIELVPGRQDALHGLVVVVLRVQAQIVERLAGRSFCLIAAEQHDGAVLGLLPVLLHLVRVELQVVRAEALHVRALVHRGAGDVAAGPGEVHDLHAIDAVLVAHDLSDLVVDLRLGPHVPDDDFLVHPDRHAAGAPVGEGGSTRNLGNSAWRELAGHGSTALRLLREVAAQGLRQLA